MKSGLFVPNAPSLRRNGVAGCVLLLLAVSGVQAVEERLEQGPDEASFRFGLASQQVDDGRLVNDDLTLFGSFDGRANYVGFHLDAWMAIDDNSFGTVDSAELTEIRARIDYLIDVPDLIQIIPHVQSSIYPHVGRAADEPVWVGIDAWYMAP